MLKVTTVSYKCIICHYCFFNHGFKFQDFVCNGCHELTTLSVNISDIAIITLKMLIIVVSFITLGNVNQIKFYSWRYIFYIYIYIYI